MHRPIRAAYTGPAILSYGFRTLFLMATLFAVIVIPLWMAVWTGHITLISPFSPTDWHIHEMLFGYVSAVIAGFLFTAIPNWTGRMPTRGWPLMVVAAVWLAGRLAVAGAFGPEPIFVMAIDCAFMAIIGAIVTVEIIAGRNFANLKVVVPVLLYLAANIDFHLEAMTTGTADTGRRLGFATVAILILLIGGRIIPSFTRNWLVKQGSTSAALPVPFRRFDAVSLGITVVALLLWVAFPDDDLVGLSLMVAGVVQLARLTRWSGWRVWPSSLLLMLHVAFAFVPAGLIAVGLASLGVLPIAAGLHLLGIGGFGGMTLAVMMRAALGHTGRELEVGPTLAAAFACVALAAVVRVAVSTNAGLWIAAALWTVGFGTFVWHFAPVLARPNAARRIPEHARPGEAAKPGQPNEETGASRSPTPGLPDVRAGGVAAHAMPNRGVSG